MQLLRRFIARVLAWRATRHRLSESPYDYVPLAMGWQPTIHREVTSTGIRVFSLCGSCGARLEASATLCEECAQRRSRLS